MYFPTDEKNKKGRWLHNLLHSLPLLRIRDLFSKEEKKKSISAKFIHGFLRSMRVHSEGLAGTQFIPVNVFEGELPLMLFFPSSQVREHLGAVTARLPAARDQLPSRPRRYRQGT